jgi:outer membrane protein TolC
MLRSWYLCTCAAVLFLSLKSDAAAQGFGGGGAQASSAQPQIGPLSGRTAQPGTVVAGQTPAPGPTTGVNTLNATVQIQGLYGGSVRRGTRPLSGALTLRDAVARGLEYNLGAVNLTALVQQARGQRRAARSSLLPTVVGDLTATREQVNLGAMGIRFTSMIPGFSFPTVVGPFNIVDLRARLSQSVLDLTAWNNYRAAKATVRADELSVEDARDLIVLAVGGAYLQTTTAAARVESARAQLETANALYQQNAQRQAVGLVAQVDVDRSQVQALTQQQRVISLQVEFAKQKINLARMIGLPPTDGYDLANGVSYETASPPALDDALRQAQERRADLKAAAAQVDAAERALAAARAQRLPSVSVNADVGAIGSGPSDARRTFAIVGNVRVPLWLGGRTEGQIDQAEAVVSQRRAELEDLTTQVEGDVRKAYLDLQAVASQVEVADRSRQVARETLDLTRLRFDAGVTDNVEVIQAQEALANAELDYINSVFAHNVAKLSLSRALGQAEERLPELLKIP